MMRPLAGWVMVGLLLATTACSSAGALTSWAAAPSPTPLSTATQVPAATATPVATATATIQAQPTRVFLADCAQTACVLAADFVLRRPVEPPAQQMADGSYLYGATQGGTRIVHSGVEFYNATGTPVLAAADGVVYYAGDDEQMAFAPWLHFYGNLIVLEHPLSDGQSLYSLYAHLSEIEVQSGATVQAGQPIGKVGMSGSAIGSHLHFEVRTDPLDYSTTRNPLLYLAPLKGTTGIPLAVLAGQVIDSAGELLTALQLVAERTDLPEYSAPQRFYLETYAPGAPSDPAWQENFVLGDLEPGQYRISLMYNGRLLERFITLSAGQITYLSLQVEN